jgi:hypothetical protein
MPRPDLKPEYIQKLEDHYEEFHSNPPPDHPKVPAGLEPRYKEMFMAGDWLADRLGDSGADPKEIEDICFAFGQRCMGSHDVWETAKASLRKFWEGRADKPGMALAEEITAQVFGGELKDSIDARQQRRDRMFQKYTKFVD